MNARLLLLCPGQGGQHSGMFDLARQHSRANALLDACGFGDATRTDLFTNQVAQPTIVAATLAMWEALKDDLPAPALIGGYSVGELSAYGVAGALDAGTAVALAVQRASAMDAAASLTPPQGIAAIGGLPLATLAELAAAAHCHVAIVTGEDSCIVGGLRRQLSALEHTVPAAGGRIEVLPVAVASHTPCMAPAVAPFAAALDAVPFAVQACPVLSGISGRRIGGKAQAVDHLSRQLREAIVWSECMDAAAEAGITVALELGPGAALSRMLAARHPAIACRSVSDFRSAAGIAAWVANQMQA